MANVDIRVGYKTAAFFAANTTLVLKDGQLMFVSDGADQGKYKIGDGVTTLTALTFYGGASVVASNAFPPIWSGQYRGAIGIAAGTSTGWAGAIYTTPYNTGSTHTVSKIRISVTTAAAATNLRIGLYTDLNGKPSTLIEGSGDISAASTGEKEYTFASPLSLTDKVYHLAIQLSSSSIGVRYWSSFLNTLPRTVGAAPLISSRATFAYAAFPANFPTIIETNAGNQMMLELLVV